MDPLRLTEVCFASARPEERAKGLLGWVCFTLCGSIRVEGVTVRKTLDGRLSLSYPARRDVSGTRRYYLRPVDTAAHRELERQIFEALGLKGAAL